MGQCEASDDASGREKPRAHDQYPQQKQQVIVTGENVSDPEQEEVRES
jgi:hypothetical protein